jgi:integrase
MVRAAYAKGRRTDELPLPDDVAREMRSFLRGADVRTPVWPNRTRSAWSAWWLEAAAMVRVDLAAAGIPERDGAGAVYDFHCLRYQFATDLERAGVGLASAQRLMRHSTPTLTAKRYTKRSAAEMAVEVNKLRKRRTEG